MNSNKGWAIWTCYRKEEKQGANGIEVFEGSSNILHIRHSSEPIKIVETFANSGGRPLETTLEWTRASVWFETEVAAKKAMLEM